jgi:colicin import membrane protein
MMDTAMHTSKQQVLPWIYSVLLHVAFVGLLVLSIHWTNSTLPSLGGTGQIAQPVQATVVDQKLINQQMALLKAQEQQKQEAQQKLQQEAQAAKTERKQEQQKLAQLQQQQAAAQQALNAKLAELQQQAQAEKAQQDKIAKLKAEAAVAAKKRQNAQRRAELQREIAVEQGALNARRAALMNQWVAVVKQKVQSNWNEPVNTPSNLSCKVQVEQVPGGTVANAHIISCNGDEAIQQSVVTAVLRSSPLPPPPEPSLFQRVFVLNFTPQNSQGN